MGRERGEREGSAMLYADKLHSRKTFFHFMCVSSERAKDRENTKRKGRERERERRGQGERINQVKSPKHLSSLFSSLSLYRLYNSSK